MKHIASIFLAALLSAPLAYSASGKTYQGVWYGEGDRCEDDSSFYAEARALGLKTVSEFGLVMAENNARNDCIAQNIDVDPKVCLGLERRANIQKKIAECVNLSYGQSIAICKCEIQFEDLR